MSCGMLQHSSEKADFEKIVKVSWIMLKNEFSQNLVDFDDGLQDFCFFFLFDILRKNAEQCHLSNFWTFVGNLREKCGQAGRKTNPIHLEQSMVHVNSRGKDAGR